MFCSTVTPGAYPGKCLPHGNMAEGDPCSSSIECASNICDTNDGVCKGLATGQGCQTYGGSFYGATGENQCVVEDYCNPNGAIGSHPTTGVCTARVSAGATCNYFFQDYTTLVK